MTIPLIDIRFMYPQALLGLLALPFVWYWMTRRRGLTVRFSSLAAARDIAPSVRTILRANLPLLRVALLALLVIALARPQKGNEHTRIRTEGIAIVLAVDISGSMQALDFRDPKTGERKDRLTVLKKVLREFVMGGGTVGGRTNDQIGLVTYAGFPDAKSPLTLDHGALAEVVESLAIPEIVEDARGKPLNPEDQSTAIGDGIIMAVERLRAAEAKSKVILLLTDGESNAGAVEPLDAAEIAKMHGIRIHAIGIGSNKPVPFPATNVYGEKVFVQRVLPLDEKTLRAAAEKTGGKYFSADNTAALQEVYAEIDRLERTKIEEKRYMEYFELFFYFAAPALVLLALEQLLALWLLRKAP